MFRRVKGQAKFRLNNFDSVIYTEEHIQEVRYRYTIEDSTGFLEIFLTIPEEADPVEQFVIHIKDLYQGYNNYVIYHGKWKHSLYLAGDSWELHKIKMY